MANNPIASHKAKPNKVYWNNFGSNKGFLLKASKSPANKIPIPAPAPTTPIVAKPAPTDLPKTITLGIKKVKIKE